MMNVVEPSPSRETIPASTAVQTTSRTGSLPTTRRMSRISGSNSPTSIIRPKKMMAKNNSTAVGAKSPMAVMMESTTPSSACPVIPNAPTITANIRGTRMSAIIGVSRLERIKYMNTAIIEKPRAMSIFAPSQPEVMKER